MESYRIANLVIQSAYLVGHLLFILMLYRRRQSTPVWFWFFIYCISLWFWVSGRFMETIVYLFFPTNNTFYQFAANYQYIGNTSSAAFYLLWVLYLSGRERLASNVWFRTLLFAGPVITWIIVFSNPLHHLFYTKLDMGERVEHGVLFVPLFLWNSLSLLAGYVVSMRFVLRTDRDRLRQLVMFSLFPLLPVIAALIRSITGVDRFDYTPLVMTVVVYSLYQIIFKHHYVNLVSLSIREVIEQTEHPIGIYDPQTGKWRYVNRIASGVYQGAMQQLSSQLSDAPGALEGEFDGKHMTVDAVPLSDDAVILTAATDMSDMVREQSELEGQIRELEKLRLELEKTRRNMDAYLETLPGPETIRKRQELIASTQGMAGDVFRKVKQNLETAKRTPAAAESVLQENLDLTRECIAAIRSAVAQLRGE